MNQYNFDEIISRKNTDCVKYDLLSPLYGRDDLISMWVADMDFRSPDCVMEAIAQRCQHDILGYPIPSNHYLDAVSLWLKRRYAISPTHKDLHFLPGVVPGISFAIQALTRPGDRILVMTPVYPPFLNLPQAVSRPVVTCPLRFVDGNFQIDFHLLDEAAKDCRMLILSNPHNPGGRVWSPDELLAISDICHRHHLIVIADEIHADLTLPAFHHTSFSSISDIARRQSLTFIAPSKTFNIAGLGSSICYIAPDAVLPSSSDSHISLRDTYFGWLDNTGVAGGNIFAFVGAEAAFRFGEPWLTQLLDYLSDNVQTLRSFLRDHLPRVKAVLPQASYLAWLDFSDYGLSHTQTRNLLTNVARVALNDGTTFGGEAYSNCFRINVGCPRSVLNEALLRIQQALNNI